MCKLWSNISESEKHKRSEGLIRHSPISCRLYSISLYTLHIFCHILGRWPSHMTNSWRNPRFFDWLGDLPFAYPIEFYVGTRQQQLGRLLLLCICICICIVGRYTQRTGSSWDILTQMANKAKKAGSQTCVKPAPLYAFTRICVCCQKFLYLYRHPHGSPCPLPCLSYQIRHIFVNFVTGAVLEVL